MTFPLQIHVFRCQIAVHQECYGANAVQDLTTWVCRACEFPQQKKECCLCPVKGTVFLLMYYLFPLPLFFFVQFHQPIEPLNDIP
jgi:hypothetical protein